MPVAGPVGDPRALDTLEVEQEGRLRLGYSGVGRVGRRHRNEKDQPKNT